MTRPAWTRAALAAATLAAAAGSSGCAAAVKHPAITAGVVGGVLGLGTCKLASDNTGACFAVGGGTGAFLGLVTAAALWLGGDGNTVMVEEQAQPLPQLEDTRPRKRRRPVDPAATDPSQPPAVPAPVSPVASPPEPAPVVGPPVVPVSPPPPAASPPPPAAPPPAGPPSPAAPSP